MKQLLIALLASNLIIQAQEITIYTFASYVDGDGNILRFVPLTDSYKWSDHIDSVVIDPKYLGYAPIENDNKHYLDKIPGLKNDWPCHGKPMMIIVDRGKENMSNDLMKMGEELDLVIQQLPGRSPWLKGTIERFFRTANDGFINSLTGTTKSNQKGNSKSRIRPHRFLTTHGEVIIKTTGGYATIEDLKLALRDTLEQLGESDNNLLLENSLVFQILDLLIWIQT